MPIFAVLIAAVLEALVSFTGGALVIFRETFANFIAHRILGFAVGALVGVVFFDLLPESIETVGVDRAFAFAVFGILLFFILERFLIWYHFHDQERTVEGYTYLALVGDAVHNFIDGVILALAFLVSTPLGIATTIAVVLHEIPQEIADLGILLRGGFSRTQALWYNFFVSLTTILGAVLTLFLGPALERALPYAVALIGGNFLYLALADLVPEVHEESGLGHFFTQVFLMVAGLSLMYFIVGLLKG